ncbi:MAG: hypothetical protein LBQ34_06685 [Alphaproteobacteria bacterium]|jgi:hypothetical protein|nr:hypothetical protein [Alphaproteobacteria bacterium]
MQERQQDLVINDVIKTITNSYLVDIFNLTAIALDSTWWGVLERAYNNIVVYDYTNAEIGEILACLYVMRTQTTGSNGNSSSRSYSVGDISVSESNSNSEASKLNMVRDILSAYPEWADSIGRIDVFNEA